MLQHSPAFVAQARGAVLLISCEVCTHPNTQPSSPHSLSNSTLTHTQAPMIHVCVVCSGSLCSSTTCAPAMASKSCKLWVWRLAVHTAWRSHMHPRQDVSIPWLLNKKTAIRAPHNNCSALQWTPLEVLGTTGPWMGLARCDCNVRCTPAHWPRAFWGLYACDTASMGPFYTPCCSSCQRAHLIHSTCRVAQWSSFLAPLARAPHCCCDTAFPR